MKIRKQTNRKIADYLLCMAESMEKGEDDEIIDNLTEAARRLDPDATGDDENEDEDLE